MVYKKEADHTREMLGVYWNTTHARPDKFFDHTGTGANVFTREVGYCNPID